MRTACRATTGMFGVDGCETRRFWKDIVRTKRNFLVNEPRNSKLIVVVDIIIELTGFQL